MKRLICPLRTYKPNEALCDLGLRGFGASLGNGDLPAQNGIVRFGSFEADLCGSISVACGQGAGVLKIVLGSFH